MNVLHFRKNDHSDSWAERESEEATRFSPARNQREERRQRLGLGPKKRVMSRRRPKMEQKEICIFQLKSERGVHSSELKEGINRKFITSPIRILKVIDSWNVEPTRPSWKPIGKKYLSHCHRQSHCCTWDTQQRRIRGIIRGFLSWSARTSSS